MGNSIWKEWFWRPRPVDEPYLRLVVFPGAGGSASLFRGWLQWLPPDVELLVVQYPARGLRMSEPAAKTLVGLARDIADAWVAFLGQASVSSVAMFGHSMGSLIAYECLHVLSLRGERVMPDQLMVSARAAPHTVPGLGAIVAAAREISASHEPVHLLPHESFKAVIRQLGGSPPEILEHAELWRMVEPMLRADVRLIEQWSFTPKPPLNLPIVAWSGAADRWVSRHDVEAWCEYSSYSFKCLTVDDGHFFVTNDQKTEFKNQLVAELTELAERRALAERTQLFDKLVREPA